MKKTLAILLALAMVFSTLTVAFAEGSLGADAQACVTLGMLKGDTSAGVTADYVAQAPTRLTAAILFLRLKGLENEALAYTGTDNFADVNLVNWAGGKAILGYLKTHPELGWVGDQGKFAPNDKMTAQAYYKVMLETLGYKQNTASVVGDFAFDKTVEFAATKGLTKVATVTNFTVNDVAIATVEALKANVKGSEKTLAASLVDAKVLTQETAVAAGVIAAPAALAVDSVTAKTAKSFVVKFNKAVEDTSKIAATTTRGSIAVTLTSAWNTEKTELTLSSSGKLVEDTYKIVVKNDAAELKTAEVKIEQEKVAKIEFLSDTLVRANDWYGYVPVKVTNQYGEDITNAPLASGIVFTGGDAAGLIRNTNKVEVRKGDTDGAKDDYQLTDLRYMTIMVVTAFDSNSATFASKTLKVSDTVGGVAEINFKGLVDKNGNAVTLSQSTTDKVFLSYEAKDAFGNIVDDYATLHNSSVINFFSSNSGIATISVEKNAQNNTKADILVSIPASAAGANWVIDMPVVFTAVAYTGGKSATYSTTIARKAAVGNFIVTAPTTQVAEGETAVIPYTAFDQAGKELTSFSDLNDAATISVSGPAAVTKLNGNIIQERAANGKYMLKMTFPTKGKYYVSAVVPTTGKMSQFTVDVRDPAKPTTLASVDSLFYPYYAPDAYQTKDFFGSYGGLTTLVKDQYDRDFNMVYQNRYALIATSDNAAIVSVNTDAVNGAGTLTATASSDEDVLGTATITLKLVDTSLASTDPHYVVDEKSTRITKIALKDIANYEILSIPTLFAVAHSTYTVDPSTSVITDAGKAFFETVTVIGKTSGGAKVRIPSTSVKARSVSDSKFGIAGSKVYADWLGTNVTEASAKLFATVVGDGGNIFTASADLKATSAAPVAEDIYVAVNYKATVVPNDSLNTITMDKTDFDTIDGKYIYDFMADGTAPTYDEWLDNDDDGIDDTFVDGTAFDFFYVETTDNYGEWGPIPTYTSITQLSGTGNAVFTVDADGVVTLESGSTHSGDQYQIQSVTSNGLVTTWKVVIR